MSVFDEIKTGLNQAIEYEKDNLKANRKTFSIAPAEEFSDSEIKDIRKNAGLTQVLLISSAKTTRFTGGYSAQGGF